MIISASRRTDIPAVFSNWFFQRVKEEYALVRNPMNYHQVSKINLSPEVVDGIVFWTKNPIPMLKRMNELEKYKNRYYFTFTLNAYGKDVEPCIPSKMEYLVPAFIELSDKLGKERVCWRYDPIFLSPRYTVEYHLQAFEALASKLGKYTEKCTVSFVDMYEKTRRNTQSLECRSPKEEEQWYLLEKMVPIAAKHGLYIDTCAEKGDFSKLGVQHAHCIDKERLERVGGYTLNVKKDPTQRLECGCFSSVEIGAYNTCSNGCLYCYANDNKDEVARRRSLHNPMSPLLYGEVEPEDKISERKMVSLIDQEPVQLDLFS